MSESCDGNCSACGASCADRKEESLLAPANEYSKIKKVIGIVSGKGGVGKSLVTSMLAVAMRRSGYKTAVLDADVTGPSIPKMFGITEKANASEFGLMPAVTKTEIELMSTNLLLEDDTAPVVWRGPVIAGAVKQFWSDVMWGGIDFMFIDMPPGTGDVPLTVFQSLPVDGIVIVASPQELVGMIVEKAVNMAAMMKIPVLALVENMSYFECSVCKTRHEIFGASHAAELAAKHGIGALCKIPIDPRLAAAADAGAIEDCETLPVEPLAAMLREMEEKS